MPTAYERKDGRWQCDVRYTLGENMPKRKKSFYASNGKEAIKKANTFLIDVERGEYQEERRDTVINFLYDYCKVCDSKWEETTKALYKMYIDVHFEPYFKSMLLKEVKPIVLDKLYNEKLNSTRKYETITKKGIKDKYRKPLSVNTVTKLNKFLKSAFNYAVKNDYIKKNPADNVIIDKTVKFKPNVYNEEQFSKLLDIVKGTDDEIPILLGAGCGLRRGEVLGLTWKNVDFDNSKISIENTAVRFDKTLEKSPKTQSSKRTIIIPDYIMKIMKEKFDQDKPPMNEGVVTRWIPQSYSEHFKNLLKKNELDHIRFHDLRHFNAVVMMKCGISDKVAAERLGHSQVSTLRNVYQHVLTDMDKKAAGQLNELFEKK